MSSARSERSTAAGSKELANLAALLSDRTRASFCLTLLDGRAWTAGELAGQAGVAPSTASEHLGRLIDGGLVAERRQGRHRYVQLAGPEVATMIEDLIAFLDPPEEPVRSLRAANRAKSLARGRTCYDHLAGRLGVAITDAMTRAGWLDQDNGFTLTTAGFGWLTGELGFVPDDRSRRPLVRPCLDWTERRSHLAGSVGAYLCRYFQERDWIRRVGSTRAVRLTRPGVDALADLLRMDTTGI